MTAVPTSLGFWAPWHPHALPQQWPFWWVLVVLDHCSRRVQGWTVLAQKPDARGLCGFLTRTTRQAGARPRCLVSDQEGIFTSGKYQRW